MKIDNTEEKINIRKKIRYIFRASKRDRFGNTMYAKNYGLKAWKIPVYEDRL